MKIPMSKIKRTNNVVMEEPKKTAPVKEEKKSSKKSENKLPSDTYKDEITPIEIPINEHNKLVISVKRSGDLGLPHVDIRHFVMSETYSGFTKKGINFPVELIDELYIQLADVMEQCEKKGF